MPRPPTTAAPPTRSLRRLGSLASTTDVSIAAGLSVDDGSADAYWSGVSLSLTLIDALSGECGVLRAGDDGAGGHRAASLLTRAHDVRVVTAVDVSSMPQRPILGTILGRTFPERSTPDFSMGKERLRPVVGGSGTDRVPSATMRRCPVHALEQGTLRRRLHRPRRGPRRGPSISGPAPVSTGRRAPARPRSASRARAVPPVAASNPGGATGRAPGDAPSAMPATPDARAARDEAGPVLSYHDGIMRAAPLRRQPLRGAPRAHRRRGRRRRPPASPEPGLGRHRRPRRHRADQPSPGRGRRRPSTSCSGTARCTPVTWWGAIGRPISPSCASRRPGFPRGGFRPSASTTPRRSGSATSCSPSATRSGSVRRSPRASSARPGDGSPAAARGRTSCRSTRRSTRAIPAAR